MDNHDDIASAGCRRKSNRFKGRDTLSNTVQAIIFLFLFSLPGCSPKIIEKVKTEYVYQDVHHRDTLITRDSIYIREWLKGDTVYVEKYKDRYVFRDRWRDSIRVVRDSVSIEHIKEVKVEKPLSAMQKAKIGAFWWVLAGLAACLVYIFRKPLIGLIKGIL
jgi:hypothetical protein